MAVDYTIKIEGIDGESKVKNHEDEIDLVEFHWAAAQSGTTHRGAGGNKGKVNVQDLVFTKYTDKASVPLMLACCTGRHVTRATLTARKANTDEPLDFFVMRFKNCLVSRFETDSTDGQDRPLEKFALSFGEFKLDYVPQREDGGGEGVVTGGFDLTVNEKI